MMDRDRLIQRIKDTSYLEGEFTLRSGKKSSYYLDKYRFQTQPDILEALASALSGYVQDSTALIAGVELGSVALAAAASLRCGLPFIIVRSSRKSYGTSNDIEGCFAPADRVLLLEDIVTTGGQVIEAIQTLQRAGLMVEQVVAVIDRLEGAQENLAASGVPFSSILTRADLGITA